MACKTCGFGMRNVHTVIVGKSLKWCPRCGTLNTERHDSGANAADVSIEWLAPTGWPHATDVLRRLWRYWRYTEAVGGAGRIESPKDILAEPGEMDTHLETIARSAASVLQDCDPEGKEKT